MRTDPTTAALTARDAFAAYMDAWNRHDPEGVLATFAPGGTFTDPMTPGVVQGEAIVAHARGLLEAFPDAAFELLSAIDGPDGTLAVQWLLRGTHTGPMSGLPPTGRALALPGSDFVRAGPEGIESLVGYFDQSTITRQLDLQVFVRPRELGPLRFGDSIHLDLGSPAKPGAFSITFIELREGELRQAHELGMAIMGQMATLPGVLSSRTMMCGSRIFTVSAWTDLDAPKALMHDGAHRQAMGAFFGGGFAVGGWTSVWAPARLGALWTRCEACQEVVKRDAGLEACRCGAPIPDVASYW